jgi:hypothetical protein
MNNSTFAISSPEEGLHIAGTPYKQQVGQTAFGSYARGMMR